MRVTVDTNVVISGTLWGGTPRRMLDLAKSGSITIYTSLTLLNELREVLAEPKFADRLLAARRTAKELIDDYSALTEIVEPVTIAPVVLNDPDDDHVLACALVAQADYIISGDRDLLNLDNYQRIPIVNATDFLNIYSATSTPRE